MKVSILLPVKDDFDGLRITLESLKGIQTGGHEIETIVCNDGGPRAISDLARQYGCVVVESPVNSGSYAARNMGVLMAKGDVLAFLDADERVDRSWMCAGVQALDEADYVGGAIDIELPERPTLWQCYDRIAAFPVLYYLERRLFAPTANLFVKRRVFEQVGCFEEGLRSGGDREFGVRVHRAGFRMAHCHDAVTFHPARDLRAQVKKVSRVARGATELEYLAWKRPASVVLRNAFMAMIKAPVRALGRIPGLAKPPVSGGDSWEARHHLMWGMVVVMYQSARIRHVLKLLREGKRHSWVSHIKPLSARDPGHDA